MNTITSFRGWFLLTTALIVVVLGGGCVYKTSIGTNTGHRTFFVVPTHLPDGSPSDEQVEQLEAWLIEEAGGYTRLGTGTGGWKSPTGEVIVEENHIYIVGIYSGDPGEFADSLNSYIVENFNQQEAWIEQW